MKTNLLNRFCFISYLKNFDKFFIVFAEGKENHPYLRNMVHVYNNSYYAIPESENDVYNDILNDFNREKKNNRT